MEFGRPWFWPVSNRVPLFGTRTSTGTGRTFEGCNFGIGFLKNKYMKFPKNFRLFLVHHNPLTHQILSKTYDLLCNRLGSMTFTTTYHGQAGAPPSCHTAQGGNFGIGFLKNKYMKFPQIFRLFLVHHNPLTHQILSKNTS